jgi:hypothetical protein
MVSTYSVATKARTYPYVIQSEAKDPTQWRDKTTVSVTAIHTGASLLNDQE